LLSFALAGAGLRQPLENSESEELSMVLGLSLQAFTVIHVLISLAGIASGIVVMHGFLINKQYGGWTAVFLTTTALTSLTGFLFPFNGFTPAIALGIMSLILLAVAIVAQYPLHLAWRKTYVITMCLALYFKRLCSGCSVVSEGGAVEGGCSNAKRAAVRDRATSSFLAVRYPDDACGKAIPQ
jgi:hypothetical protein